MNGVASLGVETCGCYVIVKNGGVEGVRMKWSSRDGVEECVGV